MPKTVKKPPRKSSAAKAKKVKPIAKKAPPAKRTAPTPPSKKAKSIAKRSTVTKAKATKKTAPTKPSKKAPSKSSASAPSKRTGPPPSGKRGTPVTKLADANPYDKKLYPKHYGIAAMLLKGKKVTWTDLYGKFGLSNRTMAVVRNHLAECGVELVRTKTAEDGVSYVAKVGPKGKLTHKELVPFVK